MYVLVLLVAPLVLLGMLGLAWVETHLLPPVEPSPPAQALPVPARDALTAGPPERPQRPPVSSRCAREPASPEFGRVEVGAAGVRYRSVLPGSPRRRSISRPVPAILLARVAGTGRP
jgi:hypothetical protein